MAFYGHEGVAYNKSKNAAVLKWSRLFGTIQKASDECSVRIVAIKSQIFLNAIRNLRSTVRRITNYAIEAIGHFQFRIKEVHIEEWRGDGCVRKPFFEQYTILTGDILACYFLCE